MAKMSSSQRWKFCSVGALLATGISLGLVMVRSLNDEAPFNLHRIFADLISEGATYAYVTGSTFLAGLILGWLMGVKTDHLQLMSLTDPLTQLANRRGFLAVFQDELQRALRYHTPLAVMLIDVDNLKQINDRQGHEAGDAALCLVAESLRSTCRASDLAARFGGDEFVVIVPSTAAHEAQELANRIRQAVAVRAGKHPGLGKISVSVGISDLTNTDVAQAEAMIASADTALYLAKAAGRDRVVLAAPPYAAARQAVCA